MTLPLNAEMLAAAYEYLRTTPPFNKWNLPDHEDIKFRTSRRPREAGRYEWDGDHHIVASIHGIAYTESLMRFMSHEMVHLHLQIMGWESKARSEEVHNAAFRKFSALVCKHHGFDPKAFY
ncbi:hypothetical protein [Bradyrhizobium sp. URHD0069]|uniref:hypothetical protein n=1 Tax=Bradyrhizobium sp. URHD0069 TaxID=1380355 RepID=UPI000497CF03|nr:hypothetical protein [Bradyrhizobium sp. URHD0069]